MSTDSTYRRLVRRETHSSRSGIAVTLAVILILVLAWLGTEAVLQAVGAAPLLVAPSDAVTAALDAVSAPAGWLVAAGVVAALVGLVLVVVGLKPGRRGRRGASSARTAAVVDDRVIARSLARTASYAGGVSPEQVDVSVAHRTALVRLTPTSGRATDVHAVEEAVRAELAGYDYAPALTAKVTLAQEGKVG
ncbi:DUF6286 domain-containing protein [Clavibacter capsici]|uniref:Uncharacterized protein n=1 Tax=Clavibacter capsici TaxID=1874630 RepID=A0AAE7CAR7_9MICO|nr:DUF6286 domain-containing protein [Clavibacter capsici]ALD11771.1 hypothetical protein AES38_01280 [Clavibacter capsici]QIS43827.1 hypothetical protein GW570_01285 [Clavibacter capsici]